MTRTTRILWLAAIVALAASTQALAKSPRIGLEIEADCPRESMDVDQLVECLGRSLALAHSWNSELEVRFDVAVLQRGRVEQVIPSHPASISGRQRIALEALELSESLEVPGGDTFIPGGDTFIPGGDTFISDEDTYTAFLADAAEAHEDDETVILVVARPHLSSLLSVVGISTTVLQLIVQ